VEGATVRVKILNVEPDRQRIGLALQAVSGAVAQEEQPAEPAPPEPPAADNEDGDEEDRDGAPASNGDRDDAPASSGEGEA
jgi:hypothetical protein